MIRKNFLMLFISGMLLVPLHASEEPTYGDPGDAPPMGAPEGAPPLDAPEESVAPKLAPVKKPGGAGTGGASGTDALFAEINARRNNPAAGLKPSSSRSGTVPGTGAVTGKPASSSSPKKASGGGAGGSDLAAQAAAARGNLRPSGGPRIEPGTGASGGGVGPSGLRRAAGPESELVKLADCLDKISRGEDPSTSAEPTGRRGGGSSASTSEGELAARVRNPGLRPTGGVPATKPTETKPESELERRIRESAERRAAAGKK